MEKKAETYEQILHDSGETVFNVRIYIQCVLLDVHLQTYTNSLINDFVQQCFYSLNLDRTGI